MSSHLVRASGKAIEPYLFALGQLRISVFAEFPYLYDGDLAYERAYLDVYLHTQQSFLFALNDATGQMVGATTCLPLSAETADVQQPFLTAGHDVQRIFYFGESVLLPQYRGRGYGKLFFDEREAFVKRQGSFDTVCFCAVDRPADHPLRPQNYQTNHVFWRKRGYTQQPDLSCTMAWKDHDQPAETSKKLIFWTKNIS